jgi:SAM-dependent methyltransferase
MTTMQKDIRQPNIFDKLRMRLRRELFLTTPLAILISATYITRRGLYKEILRIAPRIEGNILDLGCGSKPYESLFLNAKSYVGVDIEVSGHNHEDSKVDLFYDGKTLPIPDNSFDSVVCFEVLEHVFNVEEVCAEISRVLKPNGLFLLTVPFVWEEHEIPHDFARYTSYGLKHILNKNGFHVEKLIKTTTYVLTFGQLFIHYIAQNVLPNGRVLGRIFCLLVVFPLNLLTLFADSILPKRYSLYCSNVVLCQNAKS